MNALTAEEFAALQILAERRIWDVPLDNSAVGVWELERLDRREWVCAREIDRSLDGTKSHPVGPWFSPIKNERNSGRPAWPQIVHAHRKCTQTPSVSELSHRPLIAQIQLTGKAPDPFEGLESLKDSTAVQTPIQAVAEALERVSAEWRLGDCEVLDCLGDGVGPESELFSKIIRDEARSGVRRLIQNLEGHLIPAVSHQLSVDIRQELRLLTLELDPDSVGEDQYGDRMARWRHTWNALGLQPRIERLVPILFNEPESRGAQGSAKGFDQVEETETDGLPQLGPHDRQAWQLSLLDGKTQSKIAEKLNLEHGTKYTQPRISEMIKRVQRHADASGLTEKMSASGLTRTARPAVTVDPSVLDRGKRTDGRSHDIRAKQRQNAMDD